MVLISLMISVLVTVILLHGVDQFDDQCVSYCLLLHCVDQFHALCVEEALSGSPAKLNKNGNKY